MARNNLARVQLQLRDIETDRVRVIGSGGVVYNDGRHSQATAVEIVRVVALDLCNRLGGVYFDGWVYRLGLRDYYNVFTNERQEQLG